MTEKERRILEDELYRIVRPAWECANTIGARMPWYYCWDFYGSINTILDRTYCFEYTCYIKDSMEAEKFWCEILCAMKSLSTFLHDFLRKDESHESARVLHMVTEVLPKIDEWIRENEKSTPWETVKVLKGK